MLKEISLNDDDVRRLEKKLQTDRDLMAGPEVKLIESLLELAKESQTHSVD